MASGATWPPDPNEAFIQLILGKSRSGKTHLLVDMLMTIYKGRWDRIYLVCPTFRANLRKHWGKMDTSRKQGWTVYESFSPSILHDLIAKQQRHPDRHICVILDDVIGYSLQRKAQDAQLAVFASLVANFRHHRISLVLLSQKLTSVPTIFRSQCDSIVSFAMSNHRDSESLRKEIASTEHPSYQSFSKWYNDQTRNQYSFVHTINRYGRLEYCNNVRGQDLFSTERDT